MFLDSQLKPQLDLSERKWMGGFWLSESKRLGKKKRLKQKKHLHLFSLLLYKSSAILDSFAIFD